MSDTRDVKEAWERLKDAARGFEDALDRSSDARRQAVWATGSTVPRTPVEVTFCGSDHRPIKSIYVPAGAEVLLVREPWMDRMRLIKVRA